MIGGPDRQITNSDTGPAVSNGSAWPLWFIAPAMLLVALAVVLPTSVLFGLSFTDNAGFSLTHYQRVFTDTNVKILGNTLVLSLVVTALATTLGYPIAYSITRLPRVWAALCIVLVLIPFWTSALIRTYSWMILLQRRGVVNEFLLWVGIIEGPLELVHNHLGVIIGTLHIMLPFAVLPLLASLKATDEVFVRAAISLGASPLRAFWSITFPLSLAGLASSALLIFILCLGFYLTPALLGGGKVMTIAMIIHKYAALSPDWGLASALGLILIGATMVMVLAVGCVDKALARRAYR